MLTRRNLIAAPAALAASAAPTFAAERISERVQRLSQELSRALDEYGGGQFKAVVYPMGHPPTGNTTLLPIKGALWTPLEEATYHLRALERLARADGAEEVSGLIVGHGYNGRQTVSGCKAIGLHHTGVIYPTNGMFAAE